MYACHPFGLLDTKKGDPFGTFRSTTHETRKVIEEALAHVRRVPSGNPLGRSIQEYAYLFVR